MAAICGLKAFLLKPTVTSVDRCDGRRLGSASNPAREKICSTLASCDRWHAVCLKTVKSATVLAPDVDLLHRCLVYFAGYRALAQMGNQVGSLAFLVFVMVDTEPVAASTAALVENGALPQRCELTTCRARVNEFVRDDFEELVDDRTWYPEGRELGMHISVWHCGTAGAAVACAVVDAVASGARQRSHLGRSGQAVINCWKGIIVEAEEGQRVINPVH